MPGVAGDHATRHGRLMVSVWLASFLLTAVPRLAFSDVEPCVDRAELERELQARLPIEGEPTALRVARGDDAASVVVELVGDDGEQLLSRTFPGGPSDCAELPRAIAQVVERRLRALAVDAAEHSDDVPEAPPAVAAPTLAPSPSTTSEAVGVAVRAEAGVALGVLPLGGDARINVEAVVGPRRGPFLGAFASLRLDPPVTIGDGAAIAGTGLLGGVFGYAFAVGPVVVAPTVGAGAGATVAYGFGFERAYAPVFPMGLGTALVRVENSDGLSGSIGVDVPFVHIALSEAGGTDVALPSARVFVTVGVRLPTLVDLVDLVDLTD